MNRTDYILDLTCDACPEQYDVYLDGKIVGYLRLRWGEFRADFVDGDTNHTVYTAHPSGSGDFNPEERNYYLNKAVEAIDKRVHSEPVTEPEITNEDPIGWTMKNG